MTDAPGPPGTPDSVENVLAAHLQTWPGEAAAGVVALRYPSHGPEVVAAYGPADETFQWASVTKLLVSLASLVAVEEGIVSLVDAAGPPGSTFSHLLSHASGLPFEGTTPLTAPGRRRIYSNAGIEVAVTYLGTAAGMPAREYLKTGVLEPLDMGRTVVDGSPAHGARGPLGDLLALCGELLSPDLISTDTLRNATAVAWPGLAGVVPGFGRYDPCDWGLGPEVRSHKSPHWTGTANSPATFGHFGQSGAFLWVDPVVNLALAALSREPFGPWARQSWPALSDAVLAAFGHETKLQPEAAGH
ncbi:MAG TPA: serine hydrolase domain-containing protein [Acidimicrobiales bacterium]|nr:serine hydrolase domain-containing protein [Acidimicrobiales bacterium]